MNDILPTEPKSVDTKGGAILSRPATYRPWSRGRGWAIFILGMHSAAFMTFFFNPVFAFFGFACGLPAVILSGIEIRQFPEARFSGPIKWGRITGFIGVIGGPIAIFIFGLIAGLIFAAISAI